MNEVKEKIITRVGVWIAVFAACVFGLGLTIIGYLLEWGPGSGMEGPLWRILVVGILSTLIAAFVGELVVRKLAKRMFNNYSSNSQNALKAFVVVLTGCMAAVVVGFEIGFLLGKITGAIEGLDWMEVLLYTPLMAFLYAILPALAISALYSGFVYLYLKRE